MKDTVMHDLTNKFNSIPTSDVSEAVRRVADTNQKLAELHVINEKENTQTELDFSKFDTLTQIEEILESKDVSNKLKGHMVQKNSELQMLKNKVKEFVTKTEDEKTVYEIIGEK